MSVLLVVALGYSCTWSADVPQKSRYRRSEDGSNEILYLYGDIALMRVKAANLHVTATTSSFKIVFLLVKAHWLNRPSLVSDTGDQIDLVLVDNVRSIGFLEDKKAAVGTSGGQRSMFLVSNGIVKAYEDKGAFDLEVSHLGLGAVVLRDPEAVFKEYVKK